MHAAPQGGALARGDQLRPLHDVAGVAALGALRRQSASSTKLLVCWLVEVAIDNALAIAVLTRSNVREQKFVYQLSFDLWLATLGTGFLGFVGQRFLARGIEMETTGAAPAILYLDLALVFVWDEILLQERVNEWSPIGAGVICVSAVAIAVRKMREHDEGEVPRESLWRRWRRRGRELRSKSSSQLRNMP